MIYSNPFIAIKAKQNDVDAGADPIKRFQQIEVHYAISFSADDFFSLVDISAHDLLHLLRFTATQ